MASDADKKRKRQKEKEKRKHAAFMKAHDKTIVETRSKIGKNRLILLFGIIFVSAVVVFYNIR